MKKKRLNFAVCISSWSQPNTILEEYLVSSRWRINALRNWLFFEMDPMSRGRKDERFSCLLW